MASKLTAMLQSNKVERKTDLIYFDKFKDENGEVIPWQLQSITSDTNDKLLKHYTKMDVKNRTADIDTYTYNAAMVAQCVVDPDLKNKDLQEAYGVTNAIDLLGKLLLPGEYADLRDKVQDLNGFKSIDEMVGEAKNSLKETKSEELSLTLCQS